MLDPELDPELVQRLIWLHTTSETYLEYFNLMAWARRLAPGTKRPKPQRGPCPIKRIPRDREIVKTVKELQAQGLSLRKAYKKIAAIDGLTITHKAVEKIFRSRKAKYLE